MRASAPMRPRIAHMFFRIRQLRPRIVHPAQEINMQRLSASIVLILAAIGPAIAAETTERGESILDAYPECMEVNGPDCVLRSQDRPPLTAAPRGVVILPAPGSPTAATPGVVVLPAPASPIAATPGVVVISPPAPPMDATPGTSTIIVPARGATLISPRQK